MSFSNILIVEDNPINALILEKTFDKEYNCFLAINDSETFAMLEETEFSLILMDINLGRDSLDGVEIMKRIKAQDRFQDMKIFAVTSYAMPEDKKRFLSEGFDLYFSKPVERDEIKKAVAEVFFS
ncbi:response regulator [bacterium]|nr:response regulator [bacterium]